MARGGLTLYAAAPALVMMLALMAGGQHAAFRICLQRSVENANLSGSFNPGSLDKLEAALNDGHGWSSAYERTAVALQDTCDPPKPTSGYERAVIRWLWTQYIKLEPTSVVVTAYAETAQPVSQAGLNKRNNAVTD